MAIVALAVAVGSVGRVAPASVHSPGQAAQALPALALAPPPLPASPTAAVASSSPAASITPAAQTAPTAPAASAAPIQTVAPPAEPSNSVWECRINGQRTFADHPCGDNSTLHELRPMNTMEPESLIPLIQSYAPGAGYPPDNSYSGTPESDDNSYPVYIGLPYREARRPDHKPRPNHHPSRPSIR